MAKKQALLELQNRLAGRLQSAQTQAVSMAWLAVLVGESPCLLPLSHSGEIFSLPVMARVPYTQPWFSGVVNLRGGLYGVVDLAAFMGKVSARSQSEQAWAQARLVTLNVDSGVNCALIVDKLLGLRRQDALKAAEPPPEGSPAYLGHRFLDSDGQQWQEIDLQSLSQMPTFSGIGA